MSIWHADWTLATGDLNADNRTDIFVFNPATGSWYECFSTGAGFTYAGGQWSPGWEISVLDLNADRRADVVTYNATTGAMFRCMNTADGVFTWTGANWGSGWLLVTRHQTLR